MINQIESDKSNNIGLPGTADFLINQIESDKSNNIGLPGIGNFIIKLSQLSTVLGRPLASLAVTELVAAGSRGIRYCRKLISDLF